MCNLSSVGFGKYWLYEEPKRRRAYAGRPIDSYERSDDARIRQIADLYSSRRRANAS